MKYAAGKPPITSSAVNLTIPQPVSFVFKGREQSRRSIGYVAEDVHDLGLHRLLVYDENGEPLVVKYDRIALYLVEIVKELVGEVKSLKEKLNATTRVAGAG